MNTPTTPSPLQTVMRKVAKTCELPEQCTWLQQRETVNNGLLEVLGSPTFVQELNDEEKEIVVSVVQKYGIYETRLMPGIEWFKQELLQRMRCFVKPSVQEL